MTFSKEDFDFFMSTFWKDTSQKVVERIPNQQLKKVFTDCWKIWKLAGAGEKPISRTMFCWCFEIVEDPK